MLTDILAGYAAATATISLYITYRAYMTDNPKISGRIVTFVSQSQDYSFKANMSIKIYNRGRAPIAIESAYAHYFPGLIRYPWRSPWRIEIPSSTDLGLPFKIEGNSNFTKEIIGNLTVPEKDNFGNIFFYVELPTAKRVKLRSRVQINRRPVL